ncbi:chromosomal replication initiator protein DnaA [Enterovirga sp.]|uniref:chromosomal replication initiator protein DnaA n=1 Tax=Enterovirga sp. TaxID=2026350 RepID=UPI0026038D49|nr:chromosomal replication initiator protein DnaA [Enterovirga sp.]
MLARGAGQRAAEGEVEGRARQETGVAEDAWTRVKRRLRAELGEDVFSSWLARLELDQLADGKAVLSVPTRFLKSWIEAHYLDRILSTYRSEQAGLSGVSVVVRSAFRDPAAASRSSAARPAKTTSGGEPALAAEPSREDRVPAQATPLGARDERSTAELAGAPLDARLTFESFVVGRSNALAQAAAERIARNDGGAAIYNPLYIQAGVGLGKTHLLHAAGNQARAGGRRVIYLTADRFMYGFVASLKAQTSHAFKERLRGIDLLVIDDVQFIQGKTIQQEFGHTLNALIDAGRQVIVAADRPPGDLESLDERVRSRLAGGLVVEIAALDEGLRAGILSQRLAAVQATHPGFEVGPAVVAYVANAVATNGRDLEGAINRLLAHATLTGTNVTLETAEVAIRDLVRNREPRRVRIEDIQKLVATRYNVSRSDILSERRTAAVVKPRQIAMYLSKVLTLRSLPEIGRRFGGRDHTTVLHAVRKIEKLIGGDTALSEEVELLKRMLQD